MVVFLCLSSMFLSMLMLFFDKGYKKANRFLAGFMFFSALYTLTLYVIVFSGSLFWSAFFLPSFSSGFFLVGPFNYFYVRSVLTETTKLSRRDYLHFCFFIICFTGSLPFLFSSWQHKLEVATYLQRNNWYVKNLQTNVFFSGRFNQGVRPFHLFFYLVLQWGLIIKHFYRATSSIPHSGQWLIIKKWLLLLSSIYTFIGIGLCAALLKFVLNKNLLDFLHIVYYIYLACSLCYAILIASLLFFPQILYGLPFNEKIHSRTNSNSAEIVINLKQQNNENALLDSDVLTTPNATALLGTDLVSDSSLFLENEEATDLDSKQNYKDEYIVEIVDKLDAYLALNKHLAPNCNLSSLSEDTKIPVHHLSYYFNNVLSITFPDWRNNHRIQHSISLIEDGSMQNLTLNAIAQMSGFSTQKTFIKAFKSKIGTTPAEYIKSKVEIV